MSMLHTLIIDRYGDKLPDKRKELCNNCQYRYGNTLWCGGLLPITSKGEDCPYFKKLENE